jgi:hypothetical protein
MGLEDKFAPRKAVPIFEPSKTVVPRSERDITYNKTLEQFREQFQKLSYDEATALVRSIQKKA